MVKSELEQEALRHLHLEIGTLVVLVNDPGSETGVDMSRKESRGTLATSYFALHGNRVPGRIDPAPSRFAVDQRSAALTEFKRFGLRF